MNNVVACRPIRRLLAAGLLLCGFCCPSIAAESLAETAKCGKVFDKGKAGAAVPAAIMVPELAHEVFAARDCVNNKNTATACEHYGRAAAILDKMDPALAEANRADLKSLMQRYGCPQPP